MKADGSNQAHRLSDLSHKHKEVASLIGQNLGLFAVGKPGPKPVGLALPNTIIYLPISTRLVFVGVYPQVRPLLENAIRPRLLNSTSFAFCLDQCFSSENDFVIDEPERGSTQWTTYHVEGKFPKLFDDSGDLADVYAGRS